jgi:hypothetical protein
MSLIDSLAVSVIGKNTEGAAQGSVSGSSSEVGATGIQIDEDYPASTTDSLLAVAFNYADLQSIVLVSTVDLTIETNSGSSPSNTINLKAGRPFVWRKSDGYFANPFTANVTAFFITCTAAARLRGRILKS